MKIKFELISKKALNLNFSPMSSFTSHVTLGEICPSSGPRFHHLISELEVIYEVQGV